MDPNIKLTRDDGELLSDPSVYHRIIGCLLYLKVSRLNITFAIHKLSQYVAKLRTTHMNVVNHLLRYLKGCPAQGILLFAASSFQIRGFFDADWASCLDSCKSTTGYCIFLSDALVSWKAKKQNTVFRSSTVAKYRALAATSCEIVWLHQLLKDLQINSPSLSLLFCDNNAAIHIASNLIFHERTKHIELT